MATKRRSARAKKLPTQYFKDSSSEGEDDENTKAAKQKLKQMMNEDSDVSRNSIVRSSFFISLLFPGRIRFREGT